MGIQSGLEGAESFNPLVSLIISMSETVSRAMDFNQGGPWKDTSLLKKQLFFPFCKIGGKHLPLEH